MIADGRQPAKAGGKASGLRLWKRLALAGVALAAVGLIGWNLLNRYFVDKYYQDTYQPIPLSASAVGLPPAEHHLTDVPWLSTRESYCAANALRMIAAQRGREASVGEVNFLMGFTYGAAEVPGKVGIAAYTDPEPGHVFAAPYLGLVRRYYVADDASLYLKALRAEISRGRPVRVPLDFAVLYSLHGQMPHSDLLIGYDSAGFYYYETVCIEGVPCQASELPPGERGLYASDQLLLSAVIAQAREFGYPWRYAYTVFEPAAAQDDLHVVFRRNGQALVGGAQYGPKQGADAVEAFAASVERLGEGLPVGEVLSGLESAAYTRRDDAAYLRSRFAGDPEISRAGELLDRAGAAYGRVLAALSAGRVERGQAAQLAGWLQEAAAAEREAGQVLLRRGS